MAYGVDPPGPPDDWTRTLVGGLATCTPNKVTHASLGTNVLTNHGTYCTRILHNTGNTAASIWVYKNDASYNDSLFHSCRLFFRPYRINESRPDLGVWTFVQWNSGSGPLYNYSVMPLWYNPNTVIVVGHQDHTNGNYATMSNPVVQAVVPSPWVIDDWNGIRIDAVRQGNDMRITAYYVKGRVACDTLDENGEPDWTQCIDVSHIIGTTTPTVYQGTGIGSWLYTTPIYAGKSGWGLAGTGNYSNPQIHLDSIRVKQLT